MKKTLGEKIFKTNRNNFATIVPNIQLDVSDIEHVNFNGTTMYIWFKDGSRVAYWLDESALGVSEIE